MMDPYETPYFIPLFLPGQIQIQDPNAAVPFFQQRKSLANDLNSFLADSDDNKHNPADAVNIENVIPIFSPEPITIHDKGAYTPFFSKVNYYHDEGEGEKAMNSLFSKFKPAPINPVSDLEEQVPVFIRPDHANKSNMGSQKNKYAIPLFIPKPLSKLYHLGEDVYTPVFKKEPQQIEFLPPFAPKPISLLIQCADIDDPNLNIPQFTRTSIKLETPFPPFETNAYVPPISQTPDDIVFIRKNASLPPIKSLISTLSSSGYHMVQFNNIDDDVTEEEIKGKFREYGQIENFVLYRLSNGKSKGRGNVRFYDQISAKNLQINPPLFNGKAVTIIMSDKEQTTQVTDRKDYNSVYVSNIPDEIVDETGIEQLFASIEIKIVSANLVQPISHPKYKYLRRAIVRLSSYKDAKNAVMKADEMGMKIRPSFNWN